MVIGRELHSIGDSWYSSLVDNLMNLQGNETSGDHFVKACMEVLTVFGSFGDFY